MHRFDNILPSIIGGTSVTALQVLPSVAPDKITTGISLLVGLVTIISQIILLLKKKNEKSF